MVGGPPVCDRQRLEEPGGRKFAWSGDGRWQLRIKKGDGIGTDDDNGARLCRRPAAAGDYLISRGNLRGVIPCGPLRLGLLPTAVSPGLRARRIATGTRHQNRLYATSSKNPVPPGPQDFSSALLKSRLAFL
jgi:hypothetical protein